MSLPRTHRIASAGLIVAVLMALSSMIPGAAADSPKRTDIVVSVPWFAGSPTQYTCTDPVGGSLVYDRLELTMDPGVCVEHP